METFLSRITGHRSSADSFMRSFGISVAVAVNNLLIKPVIWNDLTLFTSAPGGRNSETFKTVQSVRRLGVGVFFAISCDTNSTICGVIGDAKVSLQTCSKIPIYWSHCNGCVDLCKSTCWMTDSFPFFLHSSNGRQITVRAVEKTVTAF